MSCCILLLVIYIWAVTDQLPRMGKRDYLSANVYL